MNTFTKAYEDLTKDKEIKLFQNNFSKVQQPKLTNILVKQAIRLINSQSPDQVPTLAQLNYMLKESSIPTDDGKQKELQNNIKQLNSDLSKLKEVVVNSNNSLSIKFNDTEADAHQNQQFRQAMSSIEDGDEPDHYLEQNKDMHHPEPTDQSKNGSILLVPNASTGGQAALGSHPKDHTTATQGVGNLKGIHRVFKSNDMQSDSVKNLLYHPESDNKSMLNKQKVLTKKQLREREASASILNQTQEQEVLNKPKNEWRVNPHAADEPTQKNPGKQQDRYPAWWPQSMSQSLVDDQLADMRAQNAQPVEEDTRKPERIIVGGGANPKGGIVGKMVHSPQEKVHPGAVGKVMHSPRENKNQKQNRTKSPRYLAEEPQEHEKVKTMQFDSNNKEMDLEQDAHRNRMKDEQTVKAMNNNFMQNHQERMEWDPLYIASEPRTKKASKSKAKSQIKQQVDQDRQRFKDATDLNSYSPDEVAIHFMNPEIQQIQNELHYQNNYPQKDSNIKKQNDYTIQDNHNPSLRYQVKSKNKKSNVQTDERSPIILSNRDSFASFNVQPPSQGKKKWEDNSDVDLKESKAEFESDGHKAWDHRQHGGSQSDHIRSQYEKDQSAQNNVNTSSEIDSQKALKISSILEKNKMATEEMMKEKQDDTQNLENRQNLQMREQDEQKRSLEQFQRKYNPHVKDKVSTHREKDDAHRDSDEHRLQDDQVNSRHSRDQVPRLQVTETGDALQVNNLRSNDHSSLPNTQESQDDNFSSLDNKHDKDN